MINIDYMQNVKLARKASHEDKILVSENPDIVNHLITRYSQNAVSI